MELIKKEIDKEVLRRAIKKQIDFINFHLPESGWSSDKTRSIIKDLYIVEPDYDETRKLKDDVVKKLFEYLEEREKYEAEQAELETLRSEKTE